MNNLCQMCFKNNNEQPTFDVFDNEYHQLIVFYQLCFIKSNEQPISVVFHKEYQLFIAFVNCVSRVMSKLSQMCFIMSIISWWCFFNCVSL